MVTSTLFSPLRVFIILSLLLYYLYLSSIVVPEFTIRWLALHFPPITLSFLFSVFPLQPHDLCAVAFPGFTFVCYRHQNAVTLFLSTATFYLRRSKITGKVCFCLPIFYPFLHSSLSTSVLTPIWLHCPRAPRMSLKRPTSWSGGNELPHLCLPDDIFVFLCKGSVPWQGVEVERVCRLLSPRRLSPPWPAGSRGGGRGHRHLSSYRGLGLLRAFEITSLVLQLSGHVFSVVPRPRPAGGLQSPLDV